MKRERGWRKGEKRERQRETAQEKMKDAHCIIALDSWIHLCHFSREGVTPAHS